ncbi:MAG: zinc dependent phospholipase C family protein [Desulfobacterales bacterium]|nr:zinc dependent phospholipase C family protein [Desulfobacterales bacterium]
MPKEITHFALANKLSRSVPVTSAFYEPIQRYPFLFLLGAVTPDIPFYYLAGPHRKKVQELSRPFHRSDAKSLDPVLDFIDTDRSLQALALAAGVVCHIMSDTRFHPFVYYYSGMDGIHSGATGRHRQFETAMDIHFWFLFQGETSLSRVLSQTGISRQRLVRLLSGLFRPGPLGENALGRALRWHSGIQYLFGISEIYRAFKGFARLGRPLPEKVSGLVYPFDRPRPLDFFSRQIRYQDPFTGESISTTIQSMTNLVVESELSVLDNISCALSENGESSNIKTLKDRVLSDPCLPTVRPDLPADRFGTWFQQQDIMPLLYQGTDSVI